MHLQTFQAHQPQNSNNSPLQIHLHLHPQFSDVEVVFLVKFSIFVIELKDSLNTMPTTIGKVWRIGSTKTDSPFLSVFAVLMPPPIPLLRSGIGGCAIDFVKYRPAYIFSPLGWHCICLISMIQSLFYCPLMGKVFHYAFLFLSLSSADLSMCRCSSNPAGFYSEVLG
jgi:hypothetical protein